MFKSFENPNEIVKIFFYFFRIFLLFSPFFLFLSTPTVYTSSIHHIKHIKLNHQVEVEWKFLLSVICCARKQQKILHFLAHNEVSRLKVAESHSTCATKLPQKLHKLLSILFYKPQFSCEMCVETSSLFACLRLLSLRLSTIVSKDESIKN